VAIVELNCMQPDMQSEDEPRGSEHCADYHQRILGKRPFIDLVSTSVVDADCQSGAFCARKAALRRAAEQGVWFQGHARRFHAAWDRLLTTHVLTDVAAQLLARQHHRTGGGFNFGASGGGKLGGDRAFDAPTLARAWASLHDEGGHGRTSAALHAVQAWAQATPRDASTIDAAAAAVLLRGGVAAYRAAALLLDAQLRALHAACASFRASEAKAVAAERLMRAGGTRAGFNIIKFNFNCSGSDNDDNMIYNKDEDNDNDKIVMMIKMLIMIERERMRINMMVTVDRVINMMMMIMIK